MSNPSEPPTSWRGTLGLVVVLLLACYTDLPLKRVAGAIAASPLALLGPVLLVWGGLRYGWSAIRQSPFDTAALGFLLWCNVVGIVLVSSLAVQGTYGHLGESFLGKWLKLNLYYGLLYAAFRVLRDRMRRHSERTLAHAFALVLALHAVLVAVELLLIPDALSWLHGGERPYNRIRLLTPEASTSGSVLVVLAAGLGAHRAALGAAARRAAVVFAGATLFAYSLAGRSKGYLLVIGLAIVATALLQGRHRRSPMLAVGGATLGLTVAWLLAPQAAGDLDSLLQNTTTVVTRGALVLASGFALISHPFGAGFGPHELVLSQALEPSVRLIAEWLPAAANFAEVDDYSVSSFGLFPKTGVGEIMLLAGIGGLAALWLSVRHALTTTEGSSPLRAAVLFVLLALASYINVLNKYDLLILAALVDRAALGQVTAAGRDR
jgi:hypothetical protein